MRLKEVTMNEKKHRDYAGRALLAAIAPWPISWHLANLFLKEANHLEAEGYTIESKGCLSAIIVISKIIAILFVIVFLFFLCIQYL